MAYVEVPELRAARSKTWADGNQHRLVATLTPLHYGPNLDPIDFTPTRDQRGGRDVYTVSAGWDLQLGRQLGGRFDDVDGMVSYGKGANAFRSRLVQMGLMTYATRGFVELAAANFSRANLPAPAVLTRTLGPMDETFDVGLRATWADVFPGVDVEWVADGARLKENITVPAAQRATILPVPGVYFGFVSEVDWTDIPLLELEAQPLDRATDFDDAGELAMLAATREVVGYLPHPAVRVAGVLRSVAPLVRRFWPDGLGGHLMFVGIETTELAALPAGDLIFDPTASDQPATGTDDGYVGDDAYFDATAPELVLGHDGFAELNVWTRFPVITIPDGATIDSAVITFISSANDSNDTVRHKIYFNDVDTPTAPTNLTTYNGKTRTTAAVDWDFTTNWTTGNPFDTPDLSAIWTEMMASRSYAAGRAAMLLMDSDGSNDDAIRGAVAYEDDPGDSPLLTIDYSVAGGTSIPVMRHHYAMMGRNN